MKPAEMMTALEFEAYIINILKALTLQYKIEGAENTPQPIDHWVDAFIEEAEASNE